MNTTSEVLGRAERLKQCEEIVQKLGKAAQARFRVMNGISGLVLTLIFSWSAWSDGVTLGTEGKRVFSVTGTLDLAAALYFLISTIQQLVLPSKDRLLLLLAEDYLARGKQPNSPPEPTPTSGTP